MLRKKFLFIFCIIFTFLSLAQADERTEKLKNLLKKGLITENKSTSELIEAILFTVKFLKVD